eukprot:SAG31_NODE_1780_length_7290_cov_1.784036_5_plen_39_part_00
MFVGLAAALASTVSAMAVLFVGSQVSMIEIYMVFGIHI